WRGHAGLLVGLLVGHRDSDLRRGGVGVVEAPSHVCRPGRRCDVVRRGRGGVARGALFVGGGALFNTWTFATGGDYSNFADGTYLPFVTDTWRAVVAPNQGFFISLPIALEGAGGVPARVGGGWAQLALMAGIGFHIGLMFFGWMYYPFSIAMIVAFALLLRAERRNAVAASPPTAQRNGTEG